MRFAGDRAVRHRAGGEPADDGRDRLHLIDRDGRAVAVLQLEQPAQRHQALRLVVHRRRVLLEHVVATRPRRVLQLEHRLRVEQMQLAFAAPLVLAADPQPTVLVRHSRIGVTMPLGDLFRQLVQSHAAQPRGRPGEVVVDDRL